MTDRLWGQFPSFSLDDGRASMWESPTQFDVAIIGGGPAGLSAAIILGRCLRSVILFDNGKPRNYATPRIHGYLGLEAISPKELRRRGRDQAGRYDVHFCDDEVVAIHNSSECGEESFSRFSVTSANGHQVSTRKVLLATGMKDELPDIENIRDLYGVSVHHCPYCDAWEHRGRRLIALGSGHAAVGLACALRTWSERVTACTNGAELSREDCDRLKSNQIGLRTELVVKLIGTNGVLERIVFADGSSLEGDGLFFSTARSQHSCLAAMLGCRLHSDDAVSTTPRQGTGIRGLFLAGDADGDVQFAIVAAAEGATAGTAIHRELQDEDSMRGHNPPLSVTP